MLPAGLIRLKDGGMLQKTKNKRDGTHSLASSTTEILKVQSIRAIRSKNETSI